jgi:hypothetical protein
MEVSKVSYEGYDEYLCEKGHRWAVSCYDDMKKCPVCCRDAVWHHAVDETNGMLDKEEDPSGCTRPAKLRVVRYETFQAKRPIYAIPKKGRIA